MIMKKLKKALGITQLLLILVVLVSSFGCIWLDFYLSLKILISSIVLIVFIGAIYSRLEALGIEKEEENPFMKTFQERMDKLKRRDETII